jgi:hypothetical protein
MICAVDKRLLRMTAAMTDPKMDFATTVVKNNLPAWTSYRKVLMLDFDGVVHRGDAYRTKRGIVSSDPSRIRLFEHAEVLADALEPYPDVEIVLSTSWVKVLGFDRARAALPVKALRDRVVGATYHSKFYDAHLWYGIPRGKQVLRYVTRHRLVKWLAIDDRRDGFEASMSNLVQCDPDRALGDESVREALKTGLCEIFSGDVASGYLAI